MYTPYVSPGSTTSTPAVSANTITNHFGKTLAKALQYGLIGGAALGALYGTLLMPIIGTILGVIFGAALGLIGGLANGVVIGLLTSIYFTPLTNARRYRRAARIVALLTTSAVTLITFRVLGISLHVNADDPTPVLPALFALGFAWYAARRGTRWYISAVGYQPLTIPDPNTPQMYDSAFLQRLFDDMQDTYELVCNLCSFGFGRRWRRQLIDLLDLRPGMRVLDLMSGTGETWMAILPRIGANGRLIAVDFAPAMLARARARRNALADLSIVVLDEDALRLSLPAAAADAVICTYGVKTLSPVDQERFVGEIVRVLRPGGCFGIVEIALPANRLLRWPYLWYLSYVVPIVGAIFLGNPDSYRMLSRYVAEFQNTDHLRDALRKQGCTVHSYPLFGGCATALVGITPGALGRSGA